MVGAIARGDRIACHIHQVVDLWLQIFSFDGPYGSPAFTAPNQTYTASLDVFSCYAVRLLKFRCISDLSKTVRRRLFRKEKRIFAACYAPPNFAEFAKRYEPT